MRPLLVAILAALCAAPANAQQQANDWTLVVDADKRMTLALVRYSSGQTIAVRCQDNDLEVFVTGLPPVPGVFRSVEATFPDGEVQLSSWFTVQDGALISSRTPRLDARSLRQGGPLLLAVATGSEPASPRQRYALDLPARSANLDEVLKACGADGPDSRDSLVRWSSPDDASDVWRTRPTPEYPPAAFRLGAGFAVCSCVVSGDGRLTDCRVERESHAPHFGFGRAAVRALRDARLAPLAEGGPPPGRLIVTTLQFRMPSS